MQGIDKIVLKFDAVFEHYSPNSVANELYLTSVTNDDNKYLQIAAKGFKLGTSPCMSQLSKSLSVMQSTSSALWSKVLEISMFIQL